MRRIYFIILIMGVLISLSVPLKAQVKFNFHLNIGSQPIWGPAGYDDVQYYYLPDIDTYYYVPQHRFYYQERGRWISSSSLPPRYHDYDLYSGYKVVVNEDRPYRHAQDFREKYGSYKNRHDQQPIRDSRDSKYFVNKGHPEHNNWVKQQNQNNGQGNRGNGYRQNENNKQERNGNQDKHSNQDNKDRQDKHKK